MAGVELLAGRDERAIPVIEGGVPVGIITNVDLAERAVQLGGTADATARQVAERSELDEYSGSGSAAQHVPAVADALADFGKMVRQAIAVRVSPRTRRRADAQRALRVEHRPRAT